MATQQGLPGSASRDARIAGALYFAWLMMGCVRSVYVEFAIVGGDPASRAARIAEHAVIFRLRMLAVITTAC